MRKYTIQPNDTLYLIAKKFKIPLAQLIKANPEIANPNLIYIGQTITIKNLEKNVAMKNSLQALFEANQITRFIPDILDYFKVVIPTDVSRLDYLGRQIILNVEGNDWTAANDNYTTVEKIWERLKPELNTKYSNDISNMDQTLNALRDSISRKDYQATITNANKMLDQVDVLETDFKQQNS